MKTKIVYVLTSQSSDFYYEMALLSVFSLRHYHPEAEVLLVMDEDTNRRLVDMKASILNDTIPVVVPIPQEYTVMHRSRYLKTRLPHFVSGDFLFIDGDTIICSSLMEIDQMEPEVAMAMDGNGGTAESFRYITEKCRKAGFDQLEGEPYYNGGAIYAKDCSVARTFFDTWHDIWRQSMQNGVPQDQPALYQANKLLEHPVKEMSGVWNCQFNHPQAIRYVQKAKMLHWYASSSSVVAILYRKILRHLKRRGKVTRVLAFFVLNPRPFVYTMLLLRWTLFADSPFKRVVLNVYHFFRNL